MEAALEQSSSLRAELAAAARDAAPTIAGMDTTPNPPMPEPRERILLGPTIGEGGMARVRLGVQTSLGRTVAVKVAREEVRALEPRLLQEARLTARLQHPNIVPVHDVTRGADGELQIVLKRVEGVRWSLMMRDPAALRAKYGAADALDWNLGVMIVVCHALAYAHEQGVIHRDVKPTNVMVGAFGEVYLLDWGVAATWGDHRDPDLAHVEEAPIAGTLGYMAPEQIEGEAEALGPWTDVYLLGATLYELLQGAPPHAGLTEAERCAQPRGRAIAPLGSEVPRELADLVTQALSDEPEERPLSPEHFRLRLEDYRHHRGSAALTDAAEKKLGLAQPELERGEIERLLTESELGFRAAIDSWPNNERALIGLRNVLIARVEHALSGQHPQVAREWLERLEAPPAALTERVERACAEDERARAEGALAAWQRDPAVGVFMRRTLLALFAPLWVFGWVGFAIWPAASPRPFLLFFCACVVLGFAFVFSQGLKILETQANRTNILGGASTIGMCLLWTLVCERLALSVTVAQLGFLMSVALTLWLVTFVLDKRALLPAIWTLLLLGAVALWPPFGHWAMAAASLGVAVSTVVHNHLLRAKRARLAREGQGVDSIEPGLRRKQRTTR